MSQLPWMEEANRYVGLTEFPGASHNSVILHWLDKLSAWWRDDETPWCGTFVAHCLSEAGYAVPKYWMRAKAWAEWGTRLSTPAAGCVVVFERQGGGHVGFVVGRTAVGHLMVLGGNQGNKVSIAPFDRARVVGYYWPPGLSLPIPQGLLVMSNNAPLSIREA